jgi:hypothetical protein
MKPAAGTHPGPALVAGRSRRERDNRDGAPTSGDPTRKSRLWLWFVAAFALQAAAWTTWLVLASHHRVAEVPLVGSDGGRR